MPSQRTRRRTSCAGARRRTRDPSETRWCESLSSRQPGPGCCPAGQRSRPAQQFSSTPRSRSRSIVGVTTPLVPTSFPPSSGFRPVDNLPLCHVGFDDAHQSHDQRCQHGRTHNVNPTNLDSGVAQLLSSVGCEPILIVGLGSEPAWSCWSRGARKPRISTCRSRPISIGTRQSPAVGAVGQGRDVQRISTDRIALERVAQPADAVITCALRSRSSQTLRRYCGARLGLRAWDYRVDSRRRQSS